MRWLVRQGNTINEPADVLICSANVGLNLSGGVGGEILGCYGDAMQKELHGFLAQHGIRHVQPGDVVRVSSGGTHFRVVLHAVAIDGFYGSSPELVLSTTRKALEMAASEGAKKVALTALATGYGPFTMSQFAEAIRPLLTLSLPPVEEVVICVPKDFQVGEIGAVLREAGRCDMDRRIVWQGRHLQAVVRDGYECIERRGIKGIVGIIAVTDDRKLVLVEQFRPPVQARVIELPAGLAGDTAEAKDETLESAAQRELLEETGHQARQVMAVARGAASAGLSDELITLMLAKGLTKVGEGGGDEHEDITVHAVPLDGLMDWLRDRQAQGAVIDLKVYAAFAFCGNSGGKSC